MSLFLLLAIKDSLVFAEENKIVGVQYQTHIQNIGWQNPVSNNTLSGTTGKGLRLESLKINLLSPLPSMRVKYQVHVENVGWQDWVYDGQPAGTEGKALRLEGIRIVLENAPKGYHVIYKTHVQNIGWQDWVQDGEMAGTEGKALRLESLIIKIVSPTNNTNTTISDIDLKYQTHIENIGWLDASNSNIESGKPGRDLRIEALKISIENPKENMKIKYQTHVQNVGWQNWVYGGQVSGTTGKSLRIEAIRIALENPPSGYHVYYSAYVQGAGWQNWVRDGELSGTEGKSLRIEAIQVFISKDSVGDPSNNPPPPPLKGKTVIVDPGHGGTDSGAYFNNIAEKVLNLSVSLKLKSLLDQSGATVVMTRTTDTYIDLYNRPAIAHKYFLESKKQSGNTTIPNIDYKLQLVQQVLDNSSKSGREDIGIFKLENGQMNNDLRELLDAEKNEPNIIFISIHANSSTSSSPSGPQLYYLDSKNSSYYKGYNDASRIDLANELFKNLLPALASSNTAAKIEAGNYAVIREQNFPSALVEMGFMSNQNDLTLLTNDTVQSSIAKGIYDGINEYFNSKK